MGAPKKWDDSVGRYKRLSPEARQRHIDRVIIRQRALPEVHAEYRKRTYWKLKLQAIELLGNRCAGCGTTDPLVLSINHISGRTVTGDSRTSRDLYRAVIAGEPGFDLRCMNCQRHWEYERGKLTLPTGAAFRFLREIKPQRIGS